MTPCPQCAEVSAWQEYRAKRAEQHDHTKACEQCRAGLSCPTCTILFNIAEDAHIAWSRTILALPQLPHSAESR